MRGFALLLLVLASIAGPVEAQVVFVPGMAPSILPQPVGAYYSSSVLDYDGNLFVMDVSYSMPLTLPGQPATLRFPPAVKTHVTVITSTGSKLGSRDYDGTLQVIGVGRNAVYALLSNTTSITTSTTAGPAPTLPGFNTTRRLVALKPGAGGLPETLPALDVSVRADAKLSAAAVAGGLDVIALVDAVAATHVLLPPGTATGTAEPRNAQLYRSDGNAFIPVTPTPIPLP